MDIKQLIGETTDYDKKVALETKKPKSWCKSISAFANCYGGKLVFGVANDDALVGLSDAEGDAEKISEILDVPKSKIEEHLYKKSMMERVHPEGRRLSYNVADKIENLHFDGVYLLKESKRYYPHNEMLSHVFGLCWY